MTNGPRFVRVHHTQISVPKGVEDEARAFYCGLLGLTEAPKPESLRGRGGFWLQIGDFQVHIGIEEEGDRSRTTKAHVAYEVEDLEGWRAALTENNIKILEGVPIPGCNRFEFRDPFGNRVEFLERAAE
jgi:catechol 2,3-dioxygenase-like lactoylglutathione lyase family enzyme